MANFFEGIGNALKHPIDEIGWMWDSTKGVLSGDKKLKDIPGDHQEMMNDITVPILGDNKLAKNSDAVAGAIVGGVLAAPMAAGASGSSGSLFELGNIGSYFSPNKYFTPGDDALGALADAEAGGAVEANLGSGLEALDATGKGVDWAAMSRMLQSIKPAESQRISTSGGRAGGGFRFDRNPYENKLLTREYESLYNQPLYNKLG